MSQSTPDRPLDIGILIFPELDQLDFTGPFEVLSRTPNARIQLIWKRTDPIKDMMGLVLTPIDSYISRVENGEIHVKQRTAAADVAKRMPPRVDFGKEPL